MRLSERGQNALLISIVILFAANALIIFNLSYLKIEKSRWDDVHVPLNHDTDRDGWHAIHVYYGVRDPLPPPVISEAWPGSQAGQDRMVMALIKEYKGLLPSESQLWQPYFVDLAANDAMQLSNTYALEQNGWTGLCIEPNPVYWERLAHRKCTVVAAFVGQQDLQPVNVSMNGSMGGIIGDGMDNKPAANQITRQKYTVSLRTLFLRHHVPHVIDYLSLDVEGAEWIIMKDFPFDQYSIRFMTVERPKADLKSLLSEHGYEFIQDISSFGESLWVHQSIIKGGLSKEYIQEVLKKSDS
jgi:hypothetical protein